MAKYTHQSNPKVEQIFDDLERYQDFCVEFGYPIDESTLYDMRSFAYRQHMKDQAGKSAKNQWLADSQP